MDDRTFDARVRALGHSANRRAVIGVLAGLAGLGAASASARPARGGKARASGKDGKVAICHRDGKDGGRYRKITVSANAVDAHLEQHGDFLYKDCCSDSDCPGSGVCNGAAGCGCTGANPGCYWLYPDGSRWEAMDYSREQCQQMDSCNPGGGGQSGGGCYAWMDDTLCKIAPPW